MQKLNEVRDDMRKLSQMVRDKALEIGFDNCGIVNISCLKEYRERLNERIEAFPASKPLYELLSPLAEPANSYEWAKSIIVCVSRYGKYKIPNNLKKYIGKYYFADSRMQPDSREFKNVAAFEAYLGGLGIKTAKDINKGITAGRWAALKANLGVVRKNNFLYTDHGSWVFIQTWLADKEMEYIDEQKLPACPENCTKCIDACPTKALSGPYLMNMGTCITRLSYSVRGLAPEPLREKMGTWLYGCDECQNACPMNKAKWDYKEEFPGLNELAGLTLEKIFLMEEESYIKQIQPKFWYISKEGLWIWKCNALRAMANDYRPEYRKYIIEACENENENVREMAAWARSKIGLQ